MKYFEIELKKFITKEDGTQVEDGTQTYRLRLTSSNAIHLEEKKKKSILDLVADVSISNIVDTLEYMCKDADNKFGHKEASSLYDQLIDNDYTLERILVEVIYGCLVHSGFLTKEELEEQQTQAKQAKEKLKQKILEM